MKMTLRLLFGMTLMVLFSTYGFAQTSADNGADKSTSGTSVQAKFVDNNNNGICDNHEAKGKTNCCTNFVDKDGDGVCDNKAGNENCCKKSGNGESMNYKGCVKGQANCCGRGADNGRVKGKCSTGQQGTSGASTPAGPNPIK